MDPLLCLEYLLLISILEIARGSHQTVSGPRKPHHLPGRQALYVLRRQFENRVQSTIVQRWPLSEFCSLFRVDSGTDLRFPPVPSRIFPVPLLTQCLAHHLPAARSACLSPPLMERQSLPRPTSHCSTEQKS